MTPGDRSAEAPAAKDAATAPLRALLVEDSAADQELVRRALRDPAPLPGPLEVEVVRDAAAALAAVRKARFDVILVDYALPGRDGLELLRELRETDDPTPVVMITGVGDSTVAVAALQSGAADFVVKQLGFERALPVVLDRVLRKHAADLERERRHREDAHYTRQLERQVEQQTRILRRALQESEALRRIGCTLAAARDLKPALDVVTQATAELTQAEAAAVVLRSGIEVVLVSVWGTLKQAPGVKTGDLAAALGAGWEASISARLHENEAEIGVLWAGRSRPQPFSTRDGDLLDALADMTALSIANVRAHETLRQRTSGGEPRRAEETPAPREEVAAAAPQADPGVAPPAVGRVDHAPAPPAGGRLEPDALAVPPVPAALGRLLALCDDEDATPAAVDEAVGLDPALVARTIELASAAALGRDRAATSLREAVMVLGLRGVRNVAFAQFTCGLAARGGTLDQMLWEQSIAAAAAMQQLLEVRAPALADDGYLCGLLHNVGSVAINNAYPLRYERVVQRAIAEERPVAEVEREEFGCDGASVTRHFASRWSLPARVADVYRDGVRPQEDDFVVALRWAAVEAVRTSPVWRRLLGDRPEPSWMARELEAAESALALGAAVLDDVRRAAAQRCEVLRTYGRAAIPGGGDTRAARERRV